MSDCVVDHVGHIEVGDDFADLKSRSARLMTRFCSR